MSISINTFQHKVKRKMTIFLKKTENQKKIQNICENVLTLDEKSAIFKPTILTKTSNTTKEDFS